MSKVIEFTGKKSLEAYSKASTFLQKAGFSLAPPGDNKPIGFCFGNCTIEHWSKLDATERHNLHGVITAKNYKLSPVIVTLYSDAPIEAKKAFQKAMEKVA